MTATVQMDAGALLTSLKNVADNLPKQASIISGKTATKAVSFIAKDVSKQVAVKQKTVREHIRKKKKGKTAYTVELEKSRRIPLRDFGAKQNKQGVTYRIQKGGKRGFAKDAFQGPKPGVVNVKWKGRVFKRVGSSRLPIKQLKGPSPWGVVVRGGRLSAILSQIDAELIKQTQERIRYLRLKKSGAI